MPVRFTPDLVPRYDSGMLNYINQNFLKLKTALISVSSTYRGINQPVDPQPGDLWDNDAVDVLRIWDGSAWRYVATYECRNTSPTFTQGIAISRTIVFSKSARRGGTTFASGLVTFTGPGSGGTAIRMAGAGGGDPFITAAWQVCGYGYYYRASSGLRVPVHCIASNVGDVVFQGPGAVNTFLGETGDTWLPVAAGTNDAISYTLDYPIT